MTERERSATKGESPDEWYARERAAFIAWWESEGQKKFSDTPTLAAGAGWLARADAIAPSATSFTSDSKDAARYRWLNSTDNFLIQIDGQPFRLKCGVALDKWIDAAIEREDSGNVAK